MVVGLFGAPDIVPFHLGFGRDHVQPVEEGDLVRGAQGPALGARSVVAVDVDDQRVVEFADVVDRLDDAADLVVGIGGIGGEDLDLPDEELLLDVGQLVPRLDVLRRPGRERRVLRHEAHLLLVLEDGFTQRLVAVVEEVHRLDLLDPFLRRVVRRVGGAGGIFHEEGLGRIDLVHVGDPVDRVVGHAGDQVPLAFLPIERIDLRGVAEQVRLPLVGVATDESVEILEAHAGRPLVERSGLACHEGRRVVVLAEPRGVVAVVEQDPPDGRLVLGDDAVVAGKPGGLLGDHAKAGRVVVPPGDQRRAGRRTERCRMDVGVAQAFGGQLVHRRRRDDAAEGARYAEAGIVGDDQQYVRGVCWRHDPRRPPRRRLQRVVLDLAPPNGIGAGGSWLPSSVIVPLRRSDNALRRSRPLPGSPRQTAQAKEQ